MPTISYMLKSNCSLRTMSGLSVWFTPHAILLTSPKDAISLFVLSTLLKAGGGHANEATIQLLGDIDDKNKPADYNKQNIIQLLSNISICNTVNLMEFPDAVFINNDAIPVDLKVAYNNRMSGASGRNLRYMSGIYNALLNAIESKQLLIDYIKKDKKSTKLSIRQQKNRPAFASR